MINRDFSWADRTISERGLHSNRRTRPSSARPFIVCGLVGLMAATLSGCRTEFSALRPSIKDLKGYSSQNAPTYDCAKGDEEVRACALNTLQEFAALAKAGGNLDRDLGYVLVGAGTAAAALGSNAHPRAQAIKNIAVGVAALVGIRAVANTDGQRTVLIQAQNTVTCLLRVYDSINQAKTQLAAVHPVNLRGTSEDLYQNAIARAQLSESAARSLGAQQFAAISQAQTSTGRLVVAVTDAQEASVQAFAEGLLEVRIYVQNNLDTPSQDLTGLFKMQKDNITKLTQDVTPKIASNNVDAEVASRLAGLTGVTTDSTDDVTGNAQKVAQAAAQVQNAVSSCNGS